MGLFHRHSHDQNHDHGHPHTQEHGPARFDHSKKAMRSVQAALILTLSFMGVEIVGGFFSNSLALLSDGFHMATDAGSLIVSVFTIWLARRPARGGYTYGYQRVEILGALLNGLTVWLIAGFLVFESFQRFSAPPDVRAPWVIGIGTVGLLVNLLSLKFLHASHTHSLNVRSAYLHVLTDCLGSVAAILSGIIIQVGGYRIADPILTCVFSALMLWSSWRLVREAVEVLMERSPQGVDLEAIQRTLGGLDGVEEVHDLHVWTLSSGSVAMSVHLLKSEKSEVSEGQILSRANETLAKKFGITHSTIQIESDSADCNDCGHPPDPTSKP